MARLAARLDEDEAAKMLQTAGKVGSASTLNCDLLPAATLIASYTRLAG